MPPGIARSRVQERQACASRMALHLQKGQEGGLEETWPAVLPGEQSPDRQEKIQEDPGTSHPREHTGEDH